MFETSRFISGLYLKESINSEDSPFHEKCYIYSYPVFTSSIHCVNLTLIHFTHMIRQ